MRVAATLAIAIVLLVLVVQLVFGGTGTLGSALGSALMLALLPGWIWLATLFARAGPSGLLAFLLLFGSLSTFGYAIFAIYPSYFSAPVWIAISAALFILAITLGIYGYLDEHATRIDEADKQPRKQPELG
jgi:hypothetical protein